MEFGEVLFFVLDGSRCMEEADDPADGILLFHPAEMPVQEKCCWTSQVLGLSRFWRASFKQECDVLKVAGCFLALREIRSRFLVVLGWKTPQDASTELVKLDLHEKLGILVGFVEIFLGALEDLTLVPAVLADDLVCTIFALYPMTWGDMRVRSTHTNVFKNVDFINTISTSLMHKCRISTGNGFRPQLDILCGLLSFRADVLFDEIPENLQAYRRIFLIACLRNACSKELPSTRDVDGLTYHAFHRIFLPVDDYESFRLARNVRRATDTIHSIHSVHSAHSVHSVHSVRSITGSHGQHAVSGKGVTRHCRTSTPTSETVAVLLYVLRSRGTYLALMVDVDQADEALLQLTEKLSESIPSLLNVVEESAINHILRSQTSHFVPPVTKVVYDKVEGMFSHIPEDEGMKSLLLESQLSVSLNSLVSLRVRKGNLSCDAEDVGRCQTYVVRQETPGR